MNINHKKIIALIVKDGVPFVIDQVTGMMNKSVEVEKIESSRLQLGQIEKLIKKAGKETGTSLSFKTKNIEDIGISKEELGNRTWNKFHDKVAALPGNASTDQVQEAMNEIKEMITEYPCADCREHAIENLQIMANKGKPIEAVSNRTDAILWTHDFHNVVNEMLEKPRFTLENLETKYDL